MKAKEDERLDSILCSLAMKSIEGRFHGPSDPNAIPVTTDRLTLFLIEKGILSSDAYDPAMDDPRERYVISRIHFGDHITAHLERRWKTCSIVAALSMPATIITRGRVNISGLPLARVSRLRERIAPPGSPDGSGITLADLFGGLPALPIRQMRWNDGHASILYQEEVLPWPGHLSRQ